MTTIFSSKIEKLKEEIIVSSDSKYITSTRFYNMKGQLEAYQDAEKMLLKLKEDLKEEFKWWTDEESVCQKIDDVFSGENQNPTIVEQQKEVIKDESKSSL